MLKSTINNNTLVVESITNAIQEVARATTDEITTVNVTAKSVSIVTVNKESIKALFTLYIFDIRLQQLRFTSSKEYAEAFINKFGASILK